MHAAAIGIAGFCEIQYGLRLFLGELLRHWVIEVVLRKPGRVRVAKRVERKRDLASVSCAQPTPPFNRGGQIEAV